MKHKMLLLFFFSVVHVNQYAAETNAGDLKVLVNVCIHLQKGQT